MNLTTTPDQLYSQPVLLEEKEMLNDVKFITLCIATFGLYSVWWQYKAWRFFKQRQQSDIWPAVRAIFSLFTVYDLMKNINRFSQNNDFAPVYNAKKSAAGYIILSLLVRLPDPFWLVSLLAFAFLVAPYNELRFALLKSVEYAGKDKKRFRGYHFAIIGFGVLVWPLLIYGLTLPD